MAESVCGVFVMPKKNTKSSAWLYFSLLATQDGKVIETEQDRSVCKVCGKRVLAKASNTTNLFQHLREHHPTAYTELGPKKAVKREYSSSSSSQPTLGSIITSSTLYSSNSPQAKDLNRTVAYHIAKDAMPLSTVDKLGFRFMISKLNPRYHLPSRKHSLTTRFRACTQTFETTELFQCLGRPLFSLQLLICGLVVVMTHTSHLLLLLLLLNY